MGKRGLSGVTWLAALGPFIFAVTAAALVCGAPLAPPKGDEPIVAPQDPEPGSGHEKTQEVTYEPWELVST